MRCIDTPAVGYQAVWGVSDNQRSYWTPNAAAPIGYQPQQRSEDFAAPFLAQPNPLDPVARRHQGGAFVTIDYTLPEARVDLS